MGYSIDTEKISLHDLQKRIEDTDIVPSRAVILENIEERFETLEGIGISNLQRLREELKNPKKIESVCRRADIPAEYLNLLRREIESYIAKPFSVDDFMWLPESVLKKLKDDGLNDTALLYQATCGPESINSLAEKTGIETALIEEAACLADLTRVQWVNSTVARMLLECGFSRPEELAAADADQLFADFVRVNENGKYFKHMIGLRDVKRLVKAASYI